MVPYKTKSQKQTNTKLGEKTKLMDKWDMKSDIRPTTTTSSYGFPSSWVPTYRNNEIMISICYIYIHTYDIYMLYIHTYIHTHICKPCPMQAAKYVIVANFFSSGGEVYLIKKIILASPLCVVSLIMDSDH